MNVLLAFDKFKDAIDALGACGIAESVIRIEHPDFQVNKVPLSDGGEGFARILTSAVDGQLINLRVFGPRFSSAQAVFGMVDIEKIPKAACETLSIPTSGKLAVIELAQASGLELLDPIERNPWQTSTFGVGQIIMEAIHAGADAILLGIGGSATNDCGVGAMEALGMICYDHDHQPIQRITPSLWKKVASLGSTLRISKRIPPIRIACDVRNPLLGENGATAQFGPQKGLNPEDLPQLERQMDKMARRLLGCFGHPWDTFDQRLQEPGTGAAGGIAFGLKTALPDVELVQGFALFRKWFNLDERIRDADWIFSGEGSIDEGTLQGKGPGSLIQLAGPEKQFALFAGKIDQSTSQQLLKDFPKLTFHQLSPTEWPLEKALEETATQLELMIREQLNSR
jgi:glycerate kinase